MQLRLSDLQRRAVWDGWLSAEVRAFYFADLCGRFHSRQRLATWAVLLASSGAFLTLITVWQAPDWLRAALALSAAAMSLWLLVAQYQKQATDCADLHARWRSLAHDYRALWDRMYSPDAGTQLEALVQREVELGRSSTSLPNDTKRMERWQSHVEAHYASV